MHNDVRTDAKAMRRRHTSGANTLLGYPTDARLLIINADDFGMCHAINAAILRSVREGIVCSTTLMVPCAWALHAMHLLTESPDIPFGIHLTVTCDPAHYRWGPLTCHERVPSLIDETGYFYSFDRIPAFLAQIKIEELEVEFRAQIEAVLAANLAPTHLDWHALRGGGGTAIVDLMLRLSRDYGLALRVAGETWIDQLQRQGLPTTDYDFLDSFSLDPVDKSAHYGHLLHNLPAGLSEWAVHPGINDAELHAIGSLGPEVRQTDYDFLISVEARTMIQREGITLLSYEPLQRAWRDR
ncbi:MAG: polysaccharide deacetylase family protein [Chloroflexota bacterium]|nr:polysaccharide deacetylase family protein [Chloroflexota bacterium]